MEWLRAMVVEFDGGGVGFGCLAAPSIACEGRFQTCPHPVDCWVVS